MCLKIIGMLLTFLLLVGTIASATTYECDSCDSCNTAISGATAGDYIVLNTSLSGTLNCIFFNAVDSLNFTCQGNSLSGIGDFSGFNIVSSNNITIDNCTMNGYASGIFFNSCTNSHVINIISNYNGIGLSYYGAAFNVVSNSLIANNTYGAYFEAANNLLTDDVFDGNLYGIVHISSNNTLQNSVVSNSVGEGIYPGDYANLYFNNTFNNTLNVWPTLGINIWDSMVGNYWAYPNGTGYSETCTNADGNQFCDEPYIIFDNNIDYYPLTIPSIIAPNITIITFPTLTNVTRTSCITNDTLSTNVTQLLCFGSTCNSSTYINNKICNYGCDNVTLQCSPSSFDVMIWYVIPIIVVFLIIGYLMVRRA